MEKEIIKNYKKFFIKLLIVIIIIYFLFGLIFFIFQKSLIYFPTDQNFEDCPGFNDYKKLNINNTRFYYLEKSKDLIVYYHGNAGSACDRSVLKDTFELINKSIIFVEYSGYSNDLKKPSKKLILNNVEDINTFINQINFQTITVYGQSIGASAASYQGSISNVDSLILVTPFDTMAKLTQSKIFIYPTFLLITENFDNSLYLKDYNNKITIIHGGSDQIISHKHSKKLFDNLQTPNKEYVLIQGAGHNDIWFSREFKNKIQSVLTS